MVQRKRRRAEIPLPNPSNTMDLSFTHEQMTYTCDDTTEGFLYADSGQQDPSRILIFGRESWVKILESSPICYIDGTFKITPPLFSQVFVFLGEKLGAVHPILYALLPDKKQQTYERMFGMIVDKNPSFRPSQFSCDFEIAVINSLKLVFPNARINGCFFHLSNNLYKKVVRFNLAILYGNDPNTAMNVKMILALAFVPIQHLVLYTEQLKSHLPDNLKCLMKSFEETYIRKVRNGVQVDVLFPPPIWNLYERTIEGRARTNNAAEAAHRKLARELGVQHPVIFKFIKSLKFLQKSRDTLLERLSSGFTPPTKRSKYIDADKRILTIVQNFERRTPIDYLRALAHNYSIC